MDLPQPPKGKVPNIETAWAGDQATSHLNVSIRIGTFFGVTNAYADKVARKTIDCDELCECDIHADTGDLIASFHVAPEDWQDFAHALVRKVLQYVAADPSEWNQRAKIGSNVIVGHFHEAETGRVN